MSDKTTVSRIVSRLAEIFLNLNQDYIQTTFGVNVVNPFSFNDCYIAVCTDGDLISGRIGAVVDCWWIVSVNEVREVVMEDFNVSDTIETPILKIYVEQDSFLLGERYRSDFVCRRFGKVRELEAAKSFDRFPLTWRSSPQGI